MSEKPLTWQDRLRDARAQGLLAAEFFVVLTVPAGDKVKVQEILPRHLEYQVGLAKQGKIFAAGPLSGETGTEWTGKGLIIYRAADLEEAHKIAEEDPMHKEGARTYTLYPWMMNEAKFDLEVDLTHQTVKFR